MNVRLELMTKILSDEEFIQRLPKAELHVHLEGSIPPATVLNLAEKNGLRPPFETLDTAADFFRYRDFSHFIETFVTVCGYLRTPDDYRQLVFDFAADMQAQNIRLREAFFSPTMHLTKPGLSQDAILDALAAGLAEARRAFGVSLAFIADISRQYVETADAVVDFAVAGAAAGVTIGVGIGGREAEYPPRLFERHMARARAAGLRTVAHAGEAAGPESVREALDVTKVERIGHGVRSVEDPALVARLAAEEIPLEVCPTSNLRTGVYADYAAHPLPALHAAGVPIVIGSDDPPLFGSSLTDECRHLLHDFGFSRADVCRFQLNAVRRSFLPAAEKRQLGQEFLRECAELGVAALE